MTIRKINLVLILLIMIATACGTKKCQAPATEKFRTIVDQPWRLVETTSQDEGFGSLSNTTFLVFEFTKDYKGSVKKVLNNAEYEVPVQTFQYNIDPDSGIIRAQYATPDVEGTSETAQSSSNIIDYDYELGRELELYDKTSGAYFRFVPYNGVIAPDDKCTF